MKVSKKILISNLILLMNAGFLSHANLFAGCGASKGHRVKRQVRFAQDVKIRDFQRDTKILEDIQKKEKMLVEISGISIVDELNKTIPLNVREYLDIYVQLFNEYKAIKESLLTKDNFTEVDLGELNISLLRLNKILSSLRNYFCSLLRDCMYVSKIEMIKYFVASPDIVKIICSEKDYKGEVISGISHFLSLPLFVNNYDIASILLGNDKVCDNLDLHTAYLNCRNPKVACIIKFKMCERGELFFKRKQDSPKFAGKIRK